MTDGGALLIVLAVLYFLPALLAGIRGRRNTIAIFALNLFLGWTLVGWVMALVWALSGEDRPATVTQQVVVAPQQAANGKPEKQKRCYACAEWIMKDAMKCKHCGEMQVDHLLAAEAAKRVKSTVLDAPPQTAPTAPHGPTDTGSVSIANWTAGLPSARDPNIDWESVRHSDRNIGRT